MTEQLRVLGIVEDEKDMRLLLKATLSTDPRIEIVGEAASAEEALELARSWEPHLIILDYSLEGELTGMEAAPLFKEVVPNAKILLFTAYDLRARVQENPHIDGFLRKDQFPRLMPTVKDMLGINAA